MSKRYVVTDPCYIVDNTKWDTFCDIAFQGENTNKAYAEQSKVLQSLIVEELKRLTQDETVCVADTGFGDWCNELVYPNLEHVTIINTAFGADSGMVCVCLQTPEIETILLGMGGYSHCVASFETNKEIKLDVDTSNPHWTVIRVHDKDNDDILVMTKEPEYDDEDEEDFDPWEDFEE